MVGSDTPVLCPKCGAPMVYLVERERNGKGETRITRYHRCPVCGTKVIDEKLLIKPVNGKLQVYTLTNGQKQIIYGVIRPPRRVGRRPTPRRR